LKQRQNRGTQCAVHHLENAVCRKGLEISKATNVRYRSETAENVAVEFNISRADQDAFALRSQELAVLRQLGIADDDARVNPNGGAIALGHPLGMSGARLVTAAMAVSRCARCVSVSARASRSSSNAFDRKIVSTAMSPPRAALQVRKRAWFFSFKAESGCRCIARHAVWTGKQARNSFGHG
jgi:hypothetical protein